MLTVRSLLCIAQQGPHVLVFQVHRLLSLKLQRLRLRRLCRRPPVPWFQPSLRRLCQLHSLSLRRSLRLVQLCRHIFMPQACSLRPSSQLEWHLRCWLLPYQQWPFHVNVNPDQRQTFTWGTFRNPCQFRRPRWVHMLVHHQIFLQYPSGLLQLQDFSLTVLPFLQDKHHKLSFQVRHLCLLVTTRSPVPVAFFQLLISPPFVVGPGITPVAPKIVAAIVSREFIELASLLEDHVEPEPPGFTLVADQLIIRPTKWRKAITDNLSWMQAFAVYTLVVTAYYPTRVTDLLKYQLLIMRTAQQFSGSAWLAYDRAFRRQAAAYKLTDWSHLNPKLFHFYVSGCVSVEHPSATPPIQSVSLTKPPRPADVVEVSGTPSSSTLCHSWNAGRCSSQFLRCRFRHSCDFPGCSALHRHVVAHRKAAKSPAPEPPFKRRRSSDV